MGSRGPAPKHSSERRRRNADSQPQQVQMSGPVKAPPCPKHIHARMRRWYNSLKRSGQAKFYEPSDWETALFICEAGTRLLEANKFSSELFKGVFAAMESMLSTEQERRRARIEVNRILEDEEMPEGVTAIDEYRAVLAQFQEGGS